MSGLCAIMSQYNEENDSNDISHLMMTRHDTHLIVPE